MPILPWRVSPLRYATPGTISAGSSLRRQSASASIFARRLRVAPTRSEAARSSASTMPGRISALDYRGDEERPRGQERDPAHRRDRAEPALTGESESVKTSGKEHDSREHQPARPFERRGIGEPDRDDAYREQAERMEEVVFDAGVPHRQHLGRNASFQSMRAEGAERHREQCGDTAH